MESFSTRLNLLINLSSSSNSDFAHSIRESKSQISKYLNDKGKPGFESLVSIMQKFPDLNGRWLLLGEKPVFLRDLTQNAETDKVIRDTHRKLVDLMEDMIENHECAENELAALMAKHLRAENELSFLKKAFYQFKAVFVENQESESHQANEKEKNKIKEKR